MHWSTQVRHLPPARPRPVSAAVQWTSESEKRRRHVYYAMTYKRWLSAGRTQDQLLVIGDSKEWRALVTQCSSKSIKT